MIFYDNKKMFGNYISYLNFLNEKLVKFFNRQKPYIFCKKGCAKCCKNAEFPYSFLEVRYLFYGASKLPFDVQEKIHSKAENILSKKDGNGAVTELSREIKTGEEKFLYDCPFLIDDVCSVYEYRGIVCRTFGLPISTKDSGRTKVPFCAFEGLNYSNVVDFDEKKISEEKFKTLGIKEEPVGFHIDYDFLSGEDFEKSFNLRFGPKKPLIEWFRKG